MKYYFNILEYDNNYEGECSSPYFPDRESVPSAESTFGVQV